MKTLALAALGTTFAMIAPTAEAAESIGATGADLAIPFGSNPQADASALASATETEAANRDPFTAAAENPDEQNPAQLTAWSIDVMAVPEPNSWAMMIAGFTAIGYVMRRRVTAVAFA